MAGEIEVCGLSKHLAVEGKGGARVVLGGQLIVSVFPLGAGGW